MLTAQKRGRERKERGERTKQFYWRLSGEQDAFQVFLLFLLFPIYGVQERPDPISNRVLLTLPSLSLWDSCPLTPGLLARPPLPSLLSSTPPPPSLSSPHSRLRVAGLDTAPAHTGGSAGALGRGPKALGGKKEEEVVGGP